MASSLAKEAGDASTAGSHGTYSNEKCREDECSDGKPLTESRVSFKEPIHHGCR